MQNSYGFQKKTDHKNPVWQTRCFRTWAAPQPSEGYASLLALGASRWEGWDTPILNIRRCELKMARLCSQPATVTSRRHPYKHTREPKLLNLQREKSVWGQGAGSVYKGTEVNILLHLNIQPISQGHLLQVKTGTCGQRLHKRQDRETETARGHHGSQLTPGSTPFATTWHMPPGEAPSS